MLIVVLADAVQEMPAKVHVIQPAIQCVQAALDAIVDVAVVVMVAVAVLDAAEDVLDRAAEDAAEDVHHPATLTVIVLVKILAL